MAIAWHLEGPTSVVRPVVRSALAREWRRYDRMLGPFGQRALDALRLTGGERVLDVGCGAGGLTLAVAHRTTKTGCAVGLDVDARAIAVARSRAEEQRLGWTVFALGDPEYAELPAGAFHAAVSRFGLCRASDPERALGKIRRALVPGARLALSVWRVAEDNAWFGLPRCAVSDCLGERFSQGLGASALGERPFELADEAELRSALERAGFSEIALERIDPNVWLGDDVEDALEFFFETDGRPLDDLLDRAELERVTTALRRAFSEHGRPDGVWVSSSAWIVTARVASALGCAA